jgi:hypothetical protein
MMERYGLAYVGAGLARHVLDRERGRTLCGRAYGVRKRGSDLTRRAQVTCGRCYPLAFGINGPLQYRRDLA